MRTKVTLVLLLLNVALFFFIFKFERTWRTEDALREARRRVLGSETANIQTLAVNHHVPGGVSYRLVRQREDWMLTEPLDWPANQHAVLSLVNALQFLENETSFPVAELAKSGMSLEDYGLAKPTMTISFASNEGSALPGKAGVTAGPTTVLQIGDATQVGNRLYVLSPDAERVHVVSRALLDTFSVPLEQLRADTLFTIEAFEARALSVQTGGARVRIARRDGGRWVFDTIINARASKLAMDLTFADLKRLRAATFVSPPPATLPSDSPSLRVTIDGNNRSETLLLGEPVKPAEPAAAAPTTSSGSTEFFAQLTNGNTVRAPVFTVAVPNVLLERLRNAPTELRERRILEVDAQSVTSVTIASPTQSQSITLQRLEADPASNAWQLVRPGAAGAAADTVPAEPSAVRGLLERLTMLSAARFESDAPSSAQMEAWGFNRPEREITLVESAGPGAAPRTILLQLGTDSAGTVYARAGAPAEIAASSVYVVTVDLAREFPVDPRQWRDRVVRALPAGARLAAVKVTDLATEKVLFNATADASGQLDPAPPDAAAARTLWDALRELRAKRILDEGFSERVLAAGDERIWRYRLDALVALPGGSGDRTATFELFLTERLGGGMQVAGSKEQNLTFEIEQPLVDALWALTYAGRDPGPQPEAK